MPTSGYYQYTVSDGNATITRYAGPGGNITIPSSLDGYTVTNIGRNSFFAYGITSITIPDSVISIGRSAFSGCSNLVSIFVDNGNPAYSCLDGVLYNKSQTTLICYPAGKTGSFTIPNSVTSIDSSAFYWCYRLANVTIPNSVTSIGDFAFYGCSLTSVNIPGSVTNIGSSAFYQCQNLTSVNIPSSVTNIGSFAFQDCNRLTSIVVNNGNPAYSSLAGVLYDKLQTTLICYPAGKTGSFTIPNSVTSISDYAFYNCQNLTSVIISNSVTSIGSHVFYQCRNLTNVNLPVGIASIGNYAFYYCRSLVSVTIPNSVTSIGSYAFQGCYQLTNMTIPSSVTSISDSAFFECTNLALIVVDNGNPAYCSLDGVLYNKLQTTLVCYPSKKTGSFTVPNSVTSIGDCAFSYCSSLISVNIPSSVTNIGSYAFYQCRKLTSVNIPSNVTSINDYAFYFCDSLTSVNIPNGVTSIGDYAFWGCNVLNNLSIPGSVTHIGNNAFERCHSLTSITIPNSITSLGDFTFDYCDSLTSVNIPSSVTSIGDGTFEYCPKLTSIIVDNENPAYSSLDGVLYNKLQTTLICYPTGKVGSFTIPSSVTSIGNRAFFFCHDLTSVTIPDSVISISDYAFDNCDSLTSANIPSSVTRIGDYAFHSCYKLVAVKFFGDAPDMFSFVFLSVSPQFKVYYRYGTTGFHTPIWEPDPSNKYNTEPYYVVTYNGNENTSGAVPVDSNQYLQGTTVTVLNNTGFLARTGYTFAGWNTKADGTGANYPPETTLTIGTENVVLYAKWLVSPPSRGFEFF